MQMRKEKNITDTPRTTNMQPENPPLEKEKHLQTTNFLGSMLVFGGVLVIRFSQLESTA